ncbi:hypothetical protein Trisim1_000336 [Trichoderma cf. simile WF8]|uniref:Uncharacterized protein n=1 Tax=Trichoderma guizhouense TaxID=1491466 RepID=A0A1T3CA04_9HYPO|nr:hypothetical protein A0O28_0101960 [Trichoderma guizhouense]
MLPKVQVPAAPAISSSYQSGSRHVSASVPTAEHGTADSDWLAGASKILLAHCPGIATNTRRGHQLFLPIAFSPTILLLLSLLSADHIIRLFRLRPPRIFFAPSSPCLALRHSLFPSLLHAAPDSKLVTELEATPIR